jgi:hypothetical protein
LAAAAYIVQISAEPRASFGEGHHRHRPIRLRRFGFSQFGVGLVSISQFTIAGYAVAQFAIAYSLIAQFGLYLGHGRGQLVKSVGELIGLLWSPA